MLLSINIFLLYQHMEDWTGILFLFNHELLTDRFPLFCNFWDIVHIQYVCIKFWLYLLNKLIILHFSFLSPVFSFSFILQVSFLESPYLSFKEKNLRKNLFSELKFVSLETIVLISPPHSWQVTKEKLKSAPEVCKKCPFIRFIFCTTSVISK